MQVAIEICNNCNCYVVHGSAETYFRWGGESLW